MNKNAKLMNYYTNGCNNNIGYSYIYDGIKSFKTIFTEMKERSTILFDIQGGSPIANELNYPSQSNFGAMIFAWKINGWRGGAIAIPSDDWGYPAYIAEISGTANEFAWHSLVFGNGGWQNIVSDLNIEASGFSFYSYNRETLNSPYKQGITGGADSGGVISFFIYEIYGFQLAISVALSPKLFVRGYEYNKSETGGPLWSEWKAIA